MLYDLEFLNPGNRWLPKDDDTRERINKYVRNYKIYNSKHGELDDYEDVFRRIERVITNFSEFISYTTLVNYQKLISTKITDLILSEKPNITSEDQDTIDLLIEKTSMMKNLYQAYIDVSRYGDSILYLYKDEVNDCGTFEVMDPKNWFPIFNKFNKKQVLHHVLAYEIDTGDEGRQLIVQIHSKGFFEQRVYGLIGNGISGSYQIGNELEERKVVKTGLKDFAILHISNVNTSDTIFGEDDYTIVDSLVKEIMVRVSQIARILDIHSNPSLAVPASAIEEDPETGELIVKAGNSYILDSKNDVKPEYITFDGQLEAAFNHVNLLINELAKISEMGSLLSNQDENESGLSGRALRYKLISPLTKAKRLTMFTEQQVKSLFRLLSQLGGQDIKNLTNESISIQWRDGIMDDPIEEAQIIKSRRESGTMSIERALVMFDNMSQEDAEKEIARIKEEGNHIPLDQGTPSTEDVELIDSKLTEEDVDNL